MSRPKSPERKSPVTISLPVKLKRDCRLASDKQHVSLSAWIAQLIREHFMSEAREAK